MITCKIQTDLNENLCPYDLSGEVITTIKYNKEEKYLYIDIEALDIEINFWFDKELGFELDNFNLKYVPNPEEVFEFKYNWIEGMKRFLDYIDNSHYTIETSDELYEALEEYNMI